MGLNYFCTLMCLHHRIMCFLDTVDRIITRLYWSLTSKRQQTFLSLAPSQGIVSCTLPRYIIRLQKRRKTEWLEVAAMRGSVSSIMRSASSPYYAALQTKFIHAYQSLCPFYIPFLKQSALGQSRLPRKLLLHQDSYLIVIWEGH